MSGAVLKCGQCKKEYSIEDELFADTCGHHKCRECILDTSGNSCNQCTMIGADATQKNSMNGKIPRKTKKESKVSKQTHILEQLSDLGSIQYHCTACGKTFRSRSQKYYHLQCNQLNDTLFECNICKKTFSRHSQFKYHSESHASPINKCPKCQKNFSNPLALKKHEALHKVELKNCPHCDKTFLKKISLEQHIAAQHLHQLQYGCAYCNKKYASKSTLQLHLQSHEKKRFECFFCGKYFQRNSILNLHLKRHNQTTDTYKCKMCDKLFSESGALARHRKIHEENALQYHCTLCDKNILRKDNMTRHVNTIHPDVTFDDIVLIIRPSAEANVNEHTTEKSEEHPPPIDNSKHLDVIGQADFEHIYDKSTGTEYKDLAEDYANVCEKKEIKPRNNIVIIENRLLQIPKEIQKNESAIEDGNLFSTYHLNKVNYITKFARDYNNADLYAAGNKPVIFTQVQVITPLSNIDDNLSQTKGNVAETSIRNSISDAGKQVENQIEYNTSLLLNLEQNISLTTSVAKSASGNKMFDVLTPNKHSNSLFFKSHITDTDSQKVSNEFKSQYNLSSTAPNVCETIDQAVHNKASVIRTIGNVKKMLTLTPSTTTVSKTNVPNNVLLDCEYKHKKYSRHYNVDLYRKILGCDDDDEDDSEEDQQACNHQTGKQDNSCDATNATPVHWRKSFKNSYETSTL